MKRRNFLTGGAAAFLGGAALHAQTSTPSYRTRLGALGDGHPDPWRAGMLGVRPVARVLEIFLYGGLSPWETFFVRKGLATGSCPAGCPPSYPMTPTRGKQWGTYDCEFEALWNADGARRAALVSPEDNTSSTKLFVAATDGYPEDIHLGPPTYPLWRPGIFEHLQVLVTSHDLRPHEAAIPFSLTGRQLGSAEMVGTGAVVNWNRLTSAAPPPIPVAYVVRPQVERTQDNVSAVLATGTVGATYKPIAISLPCGGGLPDLSRGLTTDQQVRLLDYYTNQYKRRLTWEDVAADAGPEAGLVRSRTFADYEGMISQYHNLDKIQGILAGYTSDPALVGGTEITSCGASGPRCPTLEGASVRQGLNLAAYLLRQENTAYVCVVDTGRYDAQGAGYDTHDNHPGDTYNNLTSTLEVLARMLDPSLPGGPKLDDNTMVVLTTEFGRGPEMEGGEIFKGRQHWPQAYVNVIIPPRSTLVLPRPRKRIVGWMDGDGLAASPNPADPQAIRSISATDLRGALLVALGVDPLSKGTALFGVGDFTSRMKDPTDVHTPSAAQEASDTGDGGDENNVRANLVRKVLGYVI